MYFVAADCTFEDVCILANFFSHAEQVYCGRVGGPGFLHVTGLQEEEVPYEKEKGIARVGITYVSGHPLAC